MGGANTEALSDEAGLLSHWAVTDAVKELGGTRKAAIAMIEERGGTVDKKSIANQMRNLQRYIEYERTGVKGKNSFAPTREKREIINDVATQKAARKGLKITMSGNISVNGYKRQRNIELILDSDQAADFLSDPNFEVLADAYHSNELHGYDDLDIQVEYL
jgi:hypothetical protein